METSQTVPLTRDAVDNNKGTIGDTQSGSDFRREVDMSRRINKVDEERTKALFPRLRNVY